MKLKTILTFILSAAIACGQSNTVNGKGGGITDSSAFLTALGGTTAGKALFTMPNPSAITFPRVNANNTVSALTASDFRTAIGLGSVLTVKAPFPIAESARTVLIHDDCSGPAYTMPDNGSRPCNPGPGTLTTWTIRTGCEWRYEGGKMVICPNNISASSGVYDSVTAAAGLAMVVRAIPGVKPRHADTLSMGFATSANGGTTHGGICVSGFAQATGAEWKGLSVGVTRANSYTGDATPPTDHLPTTVGATQLYPNYGMILPDEEGVFVTLLKSLTHQQYFMQGGRAASLGCEVGSDKWWMVGETFMDLTGLTLYPSIVAGYYSAHVIKDVQVLSEWSPGYESHCFEQSREKKGIHVAYQQVDPVSGLMVAAWNSGWQHYGSTAYIDVKYSTRLSSGAWTDAAVLLAWPNSGGLGNQVCHLSVVDGKIWLVYITVDWGATSIEGGILKRREVTINATTGAATLGAEVSLGFGTRAISFSEIVQTATGRYLLPYQEDNGSGTVTPRVAYSADGLTWTTAAVGSGTNPDSLTYMGEATITKEADDELGMYIRANSKAYYSRSTDDGATWSQPTARYDFPMPANQGTRLNARNLADGTGALLAGNDHSIQRRNLTIWKVDLTGKVVFKKTIWDPFDPTHDTASTDLYRSSQYPNICESANGDLSLMFTHQFGTNANNALSQSMRVVRYKNFLTSIPPEMTGVGQTFKKDTADVRKAPKVVELPYRAENILRLSALPTAAETFVVGAKTYTWRASVASTANEVKIGTTIGDCILAAIAAINDATASQSLYGSATSSNADATAVYSENAGHLRVRAVLGTDAGYSVATTETMANGAWSEATLFLSPADLSAGSKFAVTLAGNTLVGAPINPLPWEEITVIFIQGGSGSYTATFNVVWEFGGITPAWLAAVGATNTLRGYYNPITLKWVVTSFT